MKITITINTGNDAFVHNEVGEVCSILNELCRSLKTEDDLDFGYKKNLFDSNGGHVGHYRTSRK